MAAKEKWTPPWMKKDVKKEAPKAGAKKKTVAKKKK